MNTRQYNYLLTIASCEGLSAAAKKLGVTQAALSKFLAEQERLLGVKLFLRHQKKMYPTPAGETMLEAARNILAIKTARFRPLTALPETFLRRSSSHPRPIGEQNCSAAYSAVFPFFFLL